MEVRSLQSPRITGVPSALTRTRLREKPFASGQALKIPNRKRCPAATKLKLLGFRALASGSTKFSSEAVEANQKDANSKDDNLVFVAGATGRVGSRTIRELLKLGFKVRAGVRSPQRAESLLQSVEQMKLGVEVASEGWKPIERLEIVECDLEKLNQIGPALGNASVVICCIGASEKEVFDITGPYRIDYQATKNLIDAATIAEVNHFILLTSLGTNKIGFPAAILNLFWGVLIWKRKAEEALLASGLPYTIVRPGGMERPTDAYKETHNVTLSGEDTLFGGQVSNLQVAELIAFMAKNRSLSYCKVVEVIAETTAPLTPMGELLLKIPSQRDEVKPLKESDTAGGPRSAVLNSVVSEPPTAPVEKETARAKAMATMPLSPYIAYEDLKPPASPTPTPSTSAGATRATNGEAIPAALKSELSSMQINISKPTNAATEKEAVQMAVMKKSPLSPNTSYEDLKPPSSPSPTPSGPRERTLSDEVASHVVRGDDLAKISNNGVIEEDPPQGFTSHQSPYHAYDDLRPPTSPSPNAATGSLLPPSSSNGGSQMAKLLLNRTTQALPEDKQGDELRVVPKSWPLSPFTMYEDLKPPTSPRPSLTKS